MKPNLWWMLAWLASAWKSTRISWRTWGPMSICAPALGPMLRLCMSPGSYGQGCWIWSQVDWSTATETGSSVFVGREPRYQPGETYWAGVGQFEGGEAELPPDTHQETWRLPSSPGTSTMNCWWAWKSSKCLAKQSWPWCQWQQQKKELGKAPSKAATSELGRASPQKKAHVLGKAQASAKAKLGKAKPSKKAGKLGKSWQGGCPWKR